MTEHDPSDAEQATAAPATTDETSTSTAPDAIVDLEGLFKYSGLVDGLRDATKVLMRFGEPSRETLRQSAKQYTQLREKLQGVLRADLAEEMTTWAYDLDPETVSVDGIYMATVALARWMDLVHQAPNFMISQQVQHVNQLAMAQQAQQAQQELSAKGGGMTLPGMPGPDLPSANVGQYL